MIIWLLTFKQEKRRECSNWFLVRRAGLCDGAWHMSDHEHKNHVASTQRKSAGAANFVGASENGKFVSSWSLMCLALIFVKRRKSGQMKMNVLSVSRR